MIVTQVLFIMCVCVLPGSYHKCYHTLTVVCVKSVKKKSNINVMYLLHVHLKWCLELNDTCTRQCVTQ